MNAFSKLDPHLEVLLELVRGVVVASDDAQVLEALGQLGQRAQDNADLSVGVSDHLGGQLEVEVQLAELQVELAPLGLQLAGIPGQKGLVCKGVKTSVRFPLDRIQSNGFASVQLAGLHGRKAWSAENRHRLCEFPLTGKVECLCAIRQNSASVLRR